MSSAAQRVAKNEAFFREVNERIRTLSEPAARLGQPMYAVCECSDPECVEQVPIQIAAYEAVRAHATWVLVAGGHVDPEVDRIVRREDGYSVVERFAAERSEADPGPTA